MQTIVHEISPNLMCEYAKSEVLVVDLVLFLVILTSDIIQVQQYSIQN